jgi:O-antigen ligase
MWDILWGEIRGDPWTARGLNAHRLTLQSWGMPLELPHNDWLKLWYDLGLLGTAGYLLIMMIQVALLVRIAKRSSFNRSLRMLAYAAATAFVPYAVVMLIDNVTLYVQYFGNLHFALIGLVYGAQRGRQSG